jgi:hypothetical protein
VKALGIAGQMHGATLLDSQQVLRPAILWNDGRCGEECALLENGPQSRAITGNLMMPVLPRQNCCGYSAMNRRFSARWIKCCCRKIICVCA